jgi:hypothetical protein
MAGLMAVIALINIKSKENESIMTEDEIEKFDFYRDYEYNPTAKTTTGNWSLEPNDKDTFLLV